MLVKKLQIGKLLLEKEIITEEQLDRAIIHQSITGKKIGEVLVDLDLIQEEQLLKFLSEQLQLPIIDLLTYPLNLGLVQLIPKNTARRLQCIVLEKEDNGYYVGIVDPQDFLALDELDQILKAPIRFALIRQKDFIQLFNMIY